MPARTQASCSTPTIPVGRRQRPGLSAPRDVRRARRGRDRAVAVRPALRARRDDRAGRREDVQEPRQPRADVPASGRRGGSCRGAPGAVRRPLPGRPGLDSPAAAGGAGPAGPDAAAALDTVRSRLADDLDTRGALAAVDRWATETLTRGGRDADAPRLVRTLADTLLGIRL